MAPSLVMELIAPISGIIALLVALYLAFWINKFEPGTDKMREIYEAIRVGSKAYLRRQYKTISIISIALTLLLYVGFDFGPHQGTPYVSIAFLIGALFSLAAGYVGMDVATRANARTAYAAMKNIDLPLKIA